MAGGGGKGRGLDARVREGGGSTQDLVGGGHRGDKGRLPPSPTQRPTPPIIFWVSTPHPHPHCTEPARRQRPETPAEGDDVWRSVRSPGAGRFGGAKYENYHSTVLHTWKWDRFEAYDKFAVDSLRAAGVEVEELDLGEMTARRRSDLHLSLEDVASRASTDVCTRELPVGGRKGKTKSLQCHPSGDCLHFKKQICCRAPGECGPQEMSW